MTVGAIPQTPAPAAAPASGHGRSPAASPEKIREVAREFEAMLTRQMLTSAGVGGAEKDSPYAGMEVDAIAKAVTAGRGLGIAQQIANALAQESHSKKV
jgi:Rod binding domain-containing protein